jgi:hypothetical protein
LQPAAREALLRRMAAGEERLITAPVAVLADYADDQAGGLAGDGWWLRQSLASRRLMIEWVRNVLLAEPHRSDMVCEMLVMSLSAGKREELAFRASMGIGAVGF